MSKRNKSRIAKADVLGCHPSDLCKPERDADLKHIRVRVSKPAAERANKILFEIKEEEKRRKQEFGRLIHGSKKSTYTKAQKKGVVLIKKTSI